MNKIPLVKPNSADETSGLGSDDPQDILRITEKYPIFRQLYQEIINFRYHPKELITMYSETLKIMNLNSI